MTGHDVPPPRISWRDTLAVAGVFLRIGATAFGGPAAVIAIMRDEVVARRKWLSEQQFLDMIGATNLSPGPSASKLAMYIGHARAGWSGLCAGGLAFMAPAVAIMLVLAWAYVRYEATPAAGWLLYGIKPVIIPLIVQALWNLGQSAVKGRITALVSMAVFTLTFTGINLLALLVGGGLIVLIARNGFRLRGLVGRNFLLPLPLSLASITTPVASVSLGALFLLFLKVGAVMYGSGYVLFAFLHDDLVQGRGWLTEQQLIDAIAAGQMKPGPLSTSATFIGYLLGGLPGALLATAGIYLPAFAIVALSGSLIPRIRRSVWASRFLDGVNAAALGLMAGVTWSLARAAFVDGYAVLLGVLGGALLVRFKIGGVQLVGLGAGMGLLSAIF